MLKSENVKKSRWDDLIVDHTKIAKMELEKLQEKFRMLHLASHIRTTFIIFVCEMLYLVSLSVQGVIKFEEYLVKYCLVPFLLNIFLYFLAKRLNEKVDFKFCKNYMLILASALQVFIYAIVHQYYIMVNAGYLITIFLSTIYDDKKLVQLTSNIAVAGMLVSAFLIKYDPLYRVNYKDALNLVALACIMLIARLTAEYIVTVSIDKREKITKVIQEKEEYWNGMMMDNLSGLYSRDALRVFVDKLKVREDDAPICIVMLDLDKFKNINDTYGHQYGDQVIVNLGKTLISYYNRGIVVFRYGGEEFLCIVEGDEEYVKELMNEVKEAFNKHCADVMDNPNITFSAGISRSEKALSMSDAVKQADTALYKAKNNGRNRVEVYGEDEINFNI